SRANDASIWRRPSRSTNTRKSLPSPSYLARGSSIRVPRVRVPSSATVLSSANVSSSVISHHPPVSQQRGQYCQGVFGCPEPSHPGVSPPPHPLSASELAGAVHSAYDRFVQPHAVL